MLLAGRRDDRLALITRPNLPERLGLAATAHNARTSA